MLHGSHQVCCSWISSAVELTIKTRRKRSQKKTQNKEKCGASRSGPEGLTLRAGKQMRGSAGGQAAAFAVVPEPGWCSLQLPWESGDFWRALPGAVCCVGQPAVPTGPTQRACFVPAPVWPHSGRPLPCVSSQLEPSGKVPCLR